MVNDIFIYSQKLATFYRYLSIIRNMMRKYKFFLIVSSLIALGGFLVVTYLDIPAPDKLETKILDVNDEKIK